MSQYGVTVIWGKDALNMLPETTTTLIEYQSSEAATLINQNNKYVNQNFVPNHLPTAYPLAYAIQRLANFAACGSGEECGARKSEFYLSNTK